MMLLGEKKYFITIFGTKRLLWETRYFTLHYLCRTIPWISLQEIPNSPISKRGRGLVGKSQTKKFNSIKSCNLCGQFKQKITSIENAITKLFLGIQKQWYHLAQTTYRSYPHYKISALKLNYLVLTIVSIINWQAAFSKRLPLRKLLDNGFCQKSGVPINQNENELGH